MTERKGARGGRRRRRRRLPSGERAQRVLRELHLLGQAIAEEQGLLKGEALGLERLVLPVPLLLSAKLDPGEIEGEGESLARAAEERVLEAIKAHNAFQLGGVYCFLCDRPDCLHTRPPEVGDTFAGYTPTGKPEWQSLVSILIARNDPRLERIYEDPPEVIGLVQQAPELKGQLLPGFGKGSLVYNVLGQMMAGLLPEGLFPSRSSEQRSAITFQILETRAGHEERRLRLNMLGPSMEDISEGAARAASREPAERLRRLIWSVRQRLEALGRQVEGADRRGTRLDLDEKVGPILNSLRADVEGIFRPQRQRTAHAQRRHIGGERPTAAARGDLRRASPERLMRDTMKDTIVLLGPKGRTHIFTEEGKHVTSLQLRPGELDRKTNKKRWGPLSRREGEAFLERVRKARQQGDVRP